MTPLIQQIATTLHRSRSVLIVCHVAPDGDCLGSSLALARALSRVGVRAIVGSADGVPEPFSALPAADTITASPPAGVIDAGVAIECSTLDRAGVFAGALARASTLINIDHHLSNTGYGHLVYLDTSAAAVGEQVHEIIRALGVPLDDEMARCLLTAIVTDTGSFRFTNTTPHSLRLAATLLETGASIHEIVERVYETRSPGGTRLLGMALAKVQFSPDHRVAWTSVTAEMLAAAGALAEETAGIVGMLRQIKGVQVALLFEATPQGIRVGIRSRDGVRSNTIAESLGGGGHVGAAGFTASGSLDDVVRITLAAVEHELHSAPTTAPSAEHR